MSENKVDYNNGNISLEFYSIGFYFETSSFTNINMDYLD